MEWNFNHGMIFPSSIGPWNSGSHDSPIFSLINSYAHLNKERKTEELLLNGISVFRIGIHMKFKLLLYHPCFEWQATFDAAGYCNSRF